MSTRHDHEYEQKSQRQGQLAYRQKPRPAAVPARQPPFPPAPDPRPAGAPWFTVLLVTTLGVLLVATSVGIIALVQAGRQHVTPSTPTPGPTLTTQPAATLPPIGQWTPVLTGYHVTRIQAAADHPNVVYACTFAPGVAVGMQSAQTVVRSLDSGATWENIGARAHMGRSCELAINPADSNEIYIATSSSLAPEQATYVLEHTSNGGSRWETLSPSVIVPGQNTTLAWQGTQLRMVRNHLYSIQALPLAHPATPQWYPALLTRVLTSTDGGRTWRILDAQLATSGRSVQAYTVDPAWPAHLYELAYVPTEPGTAYPSLELYRSIDGGNTWQSVIAQLPWLAPLASSAAILSGSAYPAVIYLTSTRCPSIRSLRTSQAPALPSGSSPFSLCMSRNTGHSWQTLQAPDQVAQTMSGGIVDQQGRLYTQVTAPAAVQIWRYDPAAQLWKQVTAAPGSGELLAATPPADGATALWFLRTDGQSALYRFFIS